MGASFLQLCLVLSFLSVAFRSAHSETTNLSPHDVCDRAASSAAAETGVPENVLKAIALAESGTTVSGHFVAWPWTINVEGRGARFRSKGEALEFFEAQRASGRVNIDLGCFQINHHWHGEKFASAAAILDPESGARYAAHFLSKLYREFGNWTDAVGAYHSRNEALAKKYLARFIPIFKDLGSNEYVSNKPFKNRASNSYPLLKDGGEASPLGSLFPLEASIGRGSLFSHQGNS